MMLLLGCDSGQSIVVGPEGGQLTFPGVELSFPRGAVTNEIEVRVDSVEAPSGFVAERAFRFSPRGITFERPVVVRFIAPGGERVFWSSPERSGEFDELPATADGDDVVTNTSHFSIGFVGTPSTDMDAGRDAGDVIADGGPDGDMNVDAGMLDSGADGASDSGLDTGADADVDGVRCEAFYGTPPDCDTNFTTETAVDVDFIYSPDATPITRSLSSSFEGLTRLYTGTPVFQSLDVEGSIYEVMGSAALHRAGSRLEVDVDAQRLGLCTTGALVRVRCVGTALLPSPACDGGGRELELASLPPLACRARRRDSGCNLLPEEMETVGLTFEDGPQGTGSRIRAESSLLSEALGHDATFYREGSCPSFRLDVREGSQDDQLLLFGDRAGVAHIEVHSGATCSSGGSSVSRLVVDCSGTTTISAP